MFNRSCNIFQPVLAEDGVTQLESRFRQLDTMDEWLEHQRMVREVLFPGVRKRVAAKRKVQNDQYASKMRIVAPIPVGTLVALRDVNTN